MNENISLQDINPLTRSENQTARRESPRTVIDDASEACFLQSLRENATNFVTAAREDGWGRLKQQCRRDLEMDDNAFRYIFEDVHKRSARTTVFMTVLKGWWTARLALFRSFSSRPRIALILPDGQAIRTFLLTDVCKKLTTWADLIILSPFDLENEVAALGTRAMFLPIPLLRRNHFDHLVGYLGYLQTESPTSRKFAERLEENLQKSLKTGLPITGSLRIWQIANQYQAPGDYLKLYCWESKNLCARLHPQGSDGAVEDDQC